MKLGIFAFFLGVLLQLCLCVIYEDQIDSFSWYRQYIGNVIKAKYSTDFRRLLVLTERHSLASVTVSGEIDWLKVFSKKEKPLSVDSHKNISVTLFHGILRAWNVHNGDIFWETVFSSTSELSIDLRIVKLQGRPFIFVLREKSLNVFDLKSGRKEYYQHFPRGWIGERVFLDGANHLTLVARRDNEIVPLPVTLERSALSSELLNLVFLGPPVPSGDYIIVAGHLLYACRPAFLCSRLLLPGSQAVQHSLEALFKSEGINLQFTLQNADDIYFFLKFKELVALMSMKNGSLSVTKLWKGKAGIFGSHHSPSQRKTYISRVFLLQNNKLYSEISCVESTSFRVLHEQTVVLPASSSHASLNNVLLYVNRASILAFVTTSDHALIHFNDNGHVYTREEGLATIVRSLFVDYPPNTAQMKLLVQEFGVNEADSPLSKFIKRISSQALQFKDFVRNLLFGDLFSNKIIMKGDPLHNSDFFGFKKLIVCVSSTGKIYGLSSDKGSLLWSVLLHEDFVVSAGDVFAVTRFPSPLGLPPLCLLSCSDRGGQSYIYELDPLHGSVVRYEVPFTVKHALVLNEVDGGYNKPTIFLSYKEEAHVWPKTPNAISLALRAAPRLFFYSVNKSTGKLDGRRLLITNESVLKSVPAWSVTFSLLEETMLTVSSPRHYEQVKVLYKSVDSRGNLLYKYLNPNMIAVATHSPAASELVVYLIDTVTGRLLHRTFHPHFTATRPVTIVHSENSVYYHFWDSLEMKYIFVSLDLYEQKPVEKRPSWQPFSSFLANNPVVVRQSYYFFEGLSCASVTQTKQGITMKQLLLGLNNGQLYALDKRFLDTRRTTADKSSIPGVPVYSPVHTMDPLNVINYNRTVPHIKNIITSTTRLESLGLVFAYGLGLYSTRITPSGTFDTLSEGFNKPMLVMTTAGLIVACIIVRELMYKKKLASQWT